LQVGGLLDLKIRRLAASQLPYENLWAVSEVNGIPDFAAFDPANGNAFREFLKVARGKNAASFRQWFHARPTADRAQIVKAYIELLREVPWTQSLPSRLLRFAVTTVAGFVPGAGLVASVLDSFVVDALLKGNSPKYFVDDLKSFYAKFESKFGTQERTHEPRKDRRRHRSQFLRGEQIR
jgi:hypothetical protein